MGDTLRNRLRADVVSNSKTDEDGV